MKESINTILDHVANLPLFSFHLRVCSYRFLQHRGDKVQMIFDPRSNASSQSERKVLVSRMSHSGNQYLSRYSLFMDSRPTTQECQDEKFFSVILGTIFMEKSRYELLISKGNEILILLQVCKELIVSIYISRKTAKNSGGIFHVK